MDSKKNTIFNQFYKVARANYRSDSKLAEALNISRSTFNYYTKKNNPRSPSVATVEKWCKILNIEISKEIFKKIR